MIMMENMSILNSFKEYLTNNGIVSETSIPYTPQQNGIAERLNRTIDEKVMTMKHQSGALNKLWGELVITSNYLRNRTPYSKIGGKTPFELWNGMKPSVSHFRVFGADVIVNIPGNLRKSLDEKAYQAKFVGYSVQQKGYRVWNIEKQRIEIVGLGKGTKINVNIPHH